MKYKILLIAALLTLCSRTNCQEIDFDDSTSYNSFDVDGFELVYGNSSFDIIDYHVRYTYKVLLVRKETATFLLLNGDNLVTDELSIRSPAIEANLWNRGKTYFYNPILFYKSDLCDLDYKSGIASFRVVQDHFEYLDCKVLDKDYIGKEWFEATGDFKITFLDKEKRNKTQIGFAVNDKYIERRKATDIDGFGPSLFPYTQLGDSLVLFDIETHLMYKFGKDIEYKVVQMNPIQFKPNSNHETFELYQMLSDDITGDLYLLTNQRTKIPSKGRKKVRFIEDQSLYRFEGNEWVNLNIEIPLHAYTAQIEHGWIYAVFELTDEFNNTNKMLYKSIQRIQAR